MIVALLVAQAVATQPSASTPAPAIGGPPPASSSAWTASDEAISRGLVQAWRTSPERRVCATYTPTGTVQPRSVCGTLRSWFNGRTESETRNNRAPAVLIEEVKDQRSRARRSPAA